MLNEDSTELLEAEYKKLLKEYEDEREEND